MASLMDTLASELLGSGAVKTISASTGVESAQVKQVVGAALPILLSGMQQNSESKEGAQALAGALQQHAAEGKKSTKEQLKSVDTTDGEKIVKHILGGQTSDITKGLAKKSGLSTKQIGAILSTLAPIVLSLVSTQASDNSTDSSGLSGLLSSALFGKETSSSEGGLDLGSIAGALLGGSSSGSSGGTAGALLGSLLGSDTSSGSKKEESSATAEIAGALLGSLLGGSSEGTNGKKKEDSTADALGGLLGSLLK